MAITTKEDLYQYRIHRILKKLKKEFDENEAEFRSNKSFKDYMNCTDFDKELGGAVYNDICEYCGIDEALNSED